jgi:hypothetical protein
MDELLKSWVKPEYLPMLAIIAATVKYVITPMIKSFLSTHAKGYTSVVITMVASVVLALVFKVINPVGTWDAQGITMTVIVGIIAGFTAIGTNVTAQAIKGNDVSIKLGK